jgi:hypothetical protein
MSQDREIKILGLNVRVAITQKDHIHLQTNERFYYRGSFWSFSGHFYLKGDRWTGENPHVKSDYEKNPLRSLYIYKEGEMGAMGDIQPKTVSAKIYEACLAAVNELYSKEPNAFWMAEKEKLERGISGLESEIKELRKQIEAKLSEQVGLEHSRDKVIEYLESHGCDLTNSDLDATIEGGGD